MATVQLKVPKLRQGSFFPSLLEPRRRTERALLSVIQEAYVYGVSMRKVDDLVRALGMTEISRSKVVTLHRKGLIDEQEVESQLKQL